MKYQRKYSPKRVVLDTTYVLPLLGVKVKGLKPEILTRLSEKYELHYPSAMIPELIGVVLKQCRKKKLKTIPSEALEGLNTLLYGGTINITSPIDTDLKQAYKLYKLGLKDVFDNILYSTATRLNAYIITADKNLKTFLKQKKLKHQTIITNPENILPK